MKTLNLLTAVLLLISLSSHAQQGGLRNDIAPEKAIYQRQDGEVLMKFRDTYTYDEYEYFLAEVLTELEDLGEWLPYTRRTYEYDNNLRPATIITQRWNNGWVNQDQVLIEYNGSGYPPKIRTKTFQTWENNNWVNVSQHIYDYEPVTTIIIKDWLTDHWGNHYLYTYTPEGDEETVLLQFWKDGAWQNQEQDLITYNDNHEVKEIIHTLWDIPNWNEETRYEYTYDGPYQLNKITITEWENGGWSSTKYKTITYTHDGMGNTLHAVCASNYGGGEANNTNIELFYNQGQSVVYENVFEVEMAYVDVTSVGETPTEHFTLCPNPTSDRVSVRGEGFERAEVYSLTGQRVLESRSADIELQGIAAGAYLVKLHRHDGKTEVQKLLVQ